MGPERQLETRACEAVKKAGGYAIKLSAQYVAGLPDRILLLPDGRVWFVEFKTPKGRLSPAQAMWRRRIEAVGCNYALIRTWAEFVTCFAGIWSAAR